MVRKITESEKRLIDEKRELLDSCFERMCATTRCSEYNKSLATAKNILTQIEAISRSRFLVS